jgi:CheY-like chemotaxis protein
VLINLLGNAVKFTPENGTVAFTITLREEIIGKVLIDFSIRDTGIGIPEEALDSVFMPFQQADKEITRNYGGTGLGLAISRSIVQLFGGDIAVTSRVGEGSEFSFTLALPVTELKESNDVHIGDVTDCLKGKRALIVDDVEINRIIVTSLLESTGLLIDEAENGEVSVNAFAESPEHGYDIIYMDVQMPVMNGYEAVAAIRAMNRVDAGSVPIVALTANAFKEDIDKAIASGMNSHLAKPIDFNKMMEVTLKLLKI